MREFYYTRDFCVLHIMRSILLIFINSDFYDTQAMRDTVYVHFQLNFHSQVNILPPQYLQYTFIRQAGM